MLATAVITAAGIWIDDTRGTPARALWPHATTAVSDGRGRSFADREQRGLSDRQHRGGAVDLYGNPIEEAVGDYRIDPRGGVFERHSPATEISRLADPSA